MLAVKPEYSRPPRHRFEFVLYPHKVKRDSSAPPQELTWELVQTVRQQFAPTSSLHSAAKAFLRYWPQPAFLLKATVRGRRARPNDDVALRIDIEGFNP